MIDSSGLQVKSPSSLARQPMVLQARETKRLVICKGIDKIPYTTAKWHVDVALTGAVTGRSIEHPWIDDEPN